MLNLEQKEKTSDTLLSRLMVIEAELDEMKATQEYLAGLTEEIKEFIEYFCSFNRGRL